MGRGLFIKATDHDGKKLLIQENKILWIEEAEEGVNGCFVYMDNTNDDYDGKLRTVRLFVTQDIDYFCSNVETPMFSTFDGA